MCGSLVLSGVLLMLGFLIWCVLVLMCVSSLCWCGEEEVRISWSGVGVFMFGINIGWDCCGWV